jgi:hypothetical protein
VESPNRRLIEKNKNLQVSFEFFPPNSPAMETTLWNSIERLTPLNPSFFSVTYGAGSGTRDRTHDLSKRIQKDTASVKLMRGQIAPSVNSSLMLNLIYAFVTAVSLLVLMLRLSLAFYRSPTTKC